MKLSEKIQYAMLAVADSVSLCASTKLEVIEYLMGEKSMAVWCEKQKEEKEEKEA